MLQSCKELKLLKFKTSARTVTNFTESERSENVSHLNCFNMQSSGRRVGNPKNKKVQALLRKYFRFLSINSSKPDSPSSEVRKYMYNTITNSEYFSVQFILCRVFNIFLGNWLILMRQESFSVSKL